MQSKVKLEELYHSQNEGFLQCLREFHHPGTLKSLSEIWKKDNRPWARQQLISYLRQPFNIVGHQPVIKNIFKYAESVKDDELMAIFAVAFDRMVRHRRVTQRKYDWQNNRVLEGESLELPRNSILPRHVKLAQGNPRAAEKMSIKWILFSHHTRYYLRRRVWRYIRWMSFSQPAGYLQFVKGWITQYTNQDFEKGENILDNWSLMHALFYKSPLITFSASKIKLLESSNLSDLHAGPYQDRLWKDKSAFKVLLEILNLAQSALVRIWTIEVLKQHHFQSLKGLDILYIIRLFEQPSQEVQAFAAELFNQINTLDALTIEQWLSLLKCENPLVGQIVCEQMKKSVTPDRLAIDECIQMARSKQTPVAQLGFEFLKQKQWSSQDCLKLIGLSGMECHAMAGPVTSWALQMICSQGAYHSSHVIVFFDSLQDAARQAAWNWLTAEGCPAQNDASLWTCLSETPFDDLKLRLIDYLSRRSQIPGCGVERLVPVWSSVLLNIVRGGKQKQKALKQISEAILKNPDSAAQLLPVLVRAIRSVRTCEAGGGLAAMIGVLDSCPGLAPEVGTLMPELNLSVVEAC